MLHISTRLAASLARTDDDLDLGVVLNAGLAIRTRHGNLENAILVLRHLV